MTGSTGSLTIAPAIVTSGAAQNVGAAPGNSAPLTFVGSASTAYEQELAFHRDAFAFATADLVMPKGVDFAAREVYDGVSMRIVRAYDINNDAFPCRIDVLYGYKTIRPQLACRVTALSSLRLAGGQRPPAAFPESDRRRPCPLRPIPTSLARSNPGCAGRISPPRSRPSSPWPRRR
ncbi:MAG: P22 phage major capsid protein family protein [Caulobacteraceae bacterium]